MALTTAEVLALATEVQELGAAVAQAKAVESAHRKRVSKEEARKIALLASKLALRLIVDVLD